MVTLYIILVHTEIIEVHEEPIQQDYPESGSGESGRETSQTEFIVAYAYFHNLADPSRHICQDQDNDKQGPACHEYCLNHFRPDHGLHSTQPSINQDTYSNQTHDPTYGKARQPMDRKIGRASVREREWQNR